MSVSYEGQWPVTAFHFRATIGGQQISFQEISGLDDEVDAVEYRHGDSPSLYKMQSNGLRKASTLTFKKATFADGDELNEMWAQNDEFDYTSTGTGRQDILVEMLDEAGDIVQSWNFINCIPRKFTGATLKSDSSDVAVESIEFAHEGYKSEFA